MLLRCVSQAFAFDRPAFAQDTSWFSLEEHRQSSLQVIDGLKEAVTRISVRFY